MIVPTVEWALAAILFALGVRSLVYWLRHPFEGGDTVDLALFAAFVLGRVGIWWALAGSFALSASLRNPDPLAQGEVLAGRAFTDEFTSRFWWYPLVVIVFVVMQFLAGYFLGRRSEP